MSYLIDYKVLWLKAIVRAMAGNYSTVEGFYDRVIRIFEDSLPSDYPGKVGLVAKVSRIIYGEEA